MMDKVMGQMHRRYVMLHRPSACERVLRHLNLSTFRVFGSRTGFRRHRQKLYLGAGTVPSRIVGRNIVIVYTGAVFGSTGGPTPECISRPRRAWAGCSPAFQAVRWPLRVSAYRKVAATIKPDADVRSYWWCFGSGKGPCLS